LEKSKNLKIAYIVEKAETINSPKSRYFYAPHEGPSTALNRGLEMARGKYIAFLDDDIFYPRHLELLYKRLERENNPAVAYPTVRLNYYDKLGKIKKSIIRRVEEINLENCIKKSVNMPIMLNRECFEQSGKFYEELQMAGHDKELWLRLINRFPFYHIDEVTYEYRHFSDTNQLTHNDPFVFNYFENTVFYLHKYVKLFSFPKYSKIENFYYQALKELSFLLEKYPDLIKAFRLRSLWASRKIYGFFYDHFKSMEKIGKTQIAFQFLKASFTLNPIEPKVFFKLALYSLKKTIVIFLIIK